MWVCELGGAALWAHVYDADGSREELRVCINWNSTSSVKCREDGLVLLCMELVGSSAASCCT